jgi:hypothetical protein
MPRGRYLSDEPRVYASVPVTPHKGDVVDWPDGVPSDGNWEDAGDAAVTRGPDNAPDAQPVNAAPVPESVTDPASAPTDYTLESAPPTPEPDPVETPAAAPVAE